MPPLPIGKLWSTLVSVENRFIFQIGGFDDFDYDIYQLDTQDPTAEWIEIKLRDQIQLLRNIPEEVSSSSSDKGINNL